MSRFGVMKEVAGGKSEFDLCFLKRTFQIGF